MRPAPSRLETHLTQDAARWSSAGVAALVLLLTLPGNPAKAAEAREPKTSVPRIADIAEIKVGYSSMEELEKRLGKGKVMVGGHPNGARLWRVRGTSWVIHADAFEYSDRGVVVDSLNISVDPTPGRDVPYARLARRELVWLGEISLGMDEDRLLEILKQNACAATKVAAGWQVQAKGYSPLTSDPLEPFQEWTVRLSIKERALVGLQLDARYRRETK